MIVLITTRQIAAYYWDVAKLLSMGVKEELVSKMTPRQTKGLLKGLLYLPASYKEMAMKYDSFPIETGSLIH